MNILTMERPVTAKHSRAADTIQNFGEKGLLVTVFSVKHRVDYE